LLRDAQGLLLASLQREVLGAPAKRAPRGRLAAARLADGLGPALARLHEFPLDEARALGAPDRKMWADHYAPMINQAKAKLPRTSADWLDTRAREFLDVGGTSKAARVLIHADLSGEHIYASEGGTLEGIIDWADATIGDPALDFAGMLNDYPWRFLEAVLASYEAHGGRVDLDALRRARFYIDVAPIFGVLWAAESGFPEVERKDRRRIAARAAAGSRLSGGSVKALRKIDRDPI
jgi:aminoglycoside phosphotransferase (APT) family kinase protein